MSNSLQEFLAASARKAATDLETALGRLPADKRNWSPAESARSALNMIAECATLNGNTANIIATRRFPTDFDFSTYYRDRNELATDESATLSLLRHNTERAIAMIQQLPTADLDLEVAMPWGPMTLAQIIAYPYWNMTYHEGQINYLASMLDCLN